MTGTTTGSDRTVNTDLGPVPAHELGTVAVHEALLSVVPGAEHAPDIVIDRTEVFGILARKLTDFRDHTEPLSRPSTSYLCPSRNHCLSDVLGPRA